MMSCEVVIETLLKDLINCVVISLQESCTSGGNWTIIYECAAKEYCKSTNQSFRGFGTGVGHKLLLLFLQGYLN